MKISNLEVHLLYEKKARKKEIHLFPMSHSNSTVALINTPTPLNTSKVGMFTEHSSITG